MIQICLDDYLQTKLYFQLFDVLLKEESVNKEYYLESIGISPSSYRRAKNDEQKIGIQIVEILCTKFKLFIPSSEVIAELEDLANDIYFDMYYKIYDKYDLFMQKLDELLTKKYNIFPIAKLLKLFMLINAPKFSGELYENYLELYYEVKKYKNFYNDGLKGIYNLFVLTFENNSIDYNLAKELYGGFSYYVASFKAWKDKKYTECLYYAEKGKDILVEETNYKRIVNLNFNIMSSLMFLNRFEECFELAFNQLLMLQSFSYGKREEQITERYLLESALGIGKYDFIVKRVKDNEVFTLTEIICYMIALNQVSLSEYKVFYIKLINDLSENDKNKNICTAINKYLTCKNKENLSKLEEIPSIKYIVLALKSCKLKK